MSATVSVEQSGDVCIVTLTNTRKKNALTRDMLAQLASAVSAPAARVVVIRGEPSGGAFSSGFDIGAIDDEERAAGLDPIRAPADAIEACPVPVIAAIEGACMGGALELAMACTLRVASSSSSLAMPPARLGLVYSASGLARFLRALSPSAAQRLFLTGERVDGVEAARIGLVDVVVQPGKAEDAAVDVAGVIAQNAPLAVRGLLDAIRRLARPGGALPEDLEAIERARAQTVASEDLVEGARAFLEKRAPVFKGR